MADKDLVFKVVIRGETVALKDITKELEKVAATKISVRVDTTRAKQDVIDLQNKISKLKATAIPIKLDTAGIRAQLDGVRTKMDGILKTVKQYKIPVVLDTSGINAQIRALQAQIPTITVKVAPAPGAAPVVTPAPVVTSVPPVVPPVPPAPQPPAPPVTPTGGGIPSATQLRELKKSLYDAQCEYNKLLNSSKATGVQLDSQNNIIKGLNTQLDGIKKNVPIKEFDTLCNRGDEVRKTLQRIGRTFAAFAAIMAAREIFRGLEGLVETGIRFNAEMETAKLGIASIISSQVEYTNSVGDTLEGYQALNAAQMDSDKLVKQLQIDNLKTIATFDDLVKAFQGGLAPAMAKGFNIDQVRQYVVAMTQAAGAIGVPMDRLAQEMRSMLRGGALNPREAKIAHALGMSPDEIRSMMGNADKLFGYVMGKLQVFRTAGIESQKTWAGLTSNVIDAFKVIAGKGFEGLFVYAKKEAQSLFDWLVKINEKTGEIKLNPDVVAKMREFGESVKYAYEWVKSVIIGLGSVAGVVEGIFKAVDSRFSELKDILLAIGGIRLGATILGWITGFKSLAASVSKFVAALGLGYAIGVLLDKIVYSITGKKWDISGLNKVKDVEDEISESTKELELGNSRLAKKLKEAGFEGVNALKNFKKAAKDGLIEFDKLAGSWKTTTLGRNKPVDVDPADIAYMEKIAAETGYIDDNLKEHIKSQEAIRDLDIDIERLSARQLSYAMKVAAAYRGTKGDIGSQRALIVAYTHAVVQATLEEQAGINKIRMSYNELTKDAREYLSISKSQAENEINFLNLRNNFAPGKFYEEEISLINKKYQAETKVRSLEMALYGPSKVAQTALAYASIIDNVEEQARISESLLEYDIQRMKNDLGLNSEAKRLLEIYMRQTKAIEDQNRLLEKRSKVASLRLELAELTSNIPNILGARLDLIKIEMKKSLIQFKEMGEKANLEVKVPEVPELGPAARLEKEQKDMEENSRVTFGVIGDDFQGMLNKMDEGIKGITVKAEEMRAAIWAKEDAKLAGFGKEGVETGHKVLPPYVPPPVPKEMDWPIGWIDKNIAEPIRGYFSGSTNPPASSSKFSEEIAAAAEKFNVSADVLRGIIKVESNFNPNAIGRYVPGQGSAIGLGQIMPKTGMGMGYSEEDLLIPFKNIMATAQHYKEMLKAAKGDETLALRYYHGGQGNVDRNENIGKENLAYPGKVQAAKSELTLPTIPFRDNRVLNIRGAMTEAEDESEGLLMAWDKIQLALFSIINGTKDFSSSLNEPIGEIEEINENLTKQPPIINEIVIATDKATKSTEDLNKAGNRLTIDIAKRKMQIEMALLELKKFELVQFGAEENAKKRFEELGNTIKNIASDITDTWGQMYEELYDRATDFTIPAEERFEGFKDDVIKMWMDIPKKLSSAVMKEGMGSALKTLFGDVPILSDLAAGITGGDKPTGTASNPIYVNVLNAGLPGGAESGISDMFGGGLGSLFSSIFGGGAGGLAGAQSASVAGGWGGGGSLAGFAAIPMADGGRVTKPTLALLGERGEAENVIPDSKMGKMGNTIIINNISAVDDQSVSKLFKRQSGTISNVNRINKKRRIN